MLREYIVIDACMPRTLGLSCACGKLGTEQYVHQAYIYRREFYLIVSALFSYFPDLLLFLLSHAAYNIVSSI